jgi:NADH dehydrogenase I D subunit
MAEYMGSLGALGGRGMHIEEILEEGDLGAKRMLLNFGPQHPATHGTLRNIVALEGERVASTDPDLGFLHSGFEKQSESHTYEQVITITDRTNYMSAINNNLGYCHAVETLLGIEVTPRCKAVRTILCELGRIQDHIVCVGLLAMDLGAFSVMLWAWIEREKIYDILEYITGGRLTLSYGRIGGLARDIPEDFETWVRAFHSKVGKIVDEIEFMLSENKIFTDRTRGIGVLTAQQAISLGASGPILRASGVGRDLRKVEPYFSYDQLDFDVPVYTEGDAYARYKIRLDEMRQSLRIIDEALRNIPDGPIFVDDPRVTLPPKAFLRGNLKTPAGMASSHASIEAHIFHFKHYMYGHGIRPPKGEAYAATEAPNGELGYYLVSDGTEKPWRMRIRPPSFYNYQLFPTLGRGAMLPDLVAILAGLNVIAGELDR